MNAAERAARNEQALELHLAGVSYQRIADQLGFASKSSAHDAVRKALDSRRVVSGQAEAVQTELARLDAMLVGLWAAARRGNVAAVDRVMKIGERRVHLLALTAADDTPASGDQPNKPVSLMDELKARRNAKLAGS